MGRQIESLEEFDKFKIKLGLENMQVLMKSLGNPEKDYKIIHIAGTNGKGSTASFIEGSLIEAGYKTDKYTSPEIFSFNERVTVNKEEITDEELEDYSSKLKKIISDNK
ncbi:MAG: bifunctional folylpolyglutamate synthase/dihydrofolate synthase, partial [Sebaldella sp.]|nr:bifunctional folylpolyglutamate synthase/dihydrofolate synthase [Sebaldella sp.]